MSYQPNPEKIQNLCKNHQDAEFSATILDQDDQVLSKGTGLLYAPSPGGAFWPEDPATLDEPHKTSLFLKPKDAEKIPIDDFQHCKKGLDFHYHFRTKE